MLQMTNVQIIEKEKAILGIEEQAHTYATWNELGYQVKKGEKAKFTTKIWKKAKSKKEKNEETEGNYFLKLSFFFTESQVEKK
jgi:hypothetical protein